MPQGCIQMFSFDFFPIFSQVRGPFWVTKSAGPGAVAPLKTATAQSISVATWPALACPKICNIKLEYLLTYRKTLVP